MDSKFVTFMLYPRSEADLVLIENFRRAVIVFGKSESGAILDAMESFVLGVAIDPASDGFSGILRGGEFRTFVFEKLGLQLDGATLKSWHRRRWRLGYEYFESRGKGKNVQYAYDVRRCWKWICAYAERKGLSVSVDQVAAADAEFGRLLVADDQMRYRLGVPKVEAIGMDTVRTGKKKAVPESDQVESEQGVDQRKADGGVSVRPMGDPAKMGWNLKKK